MSGRPTVSIDDAGRLDAVRRTELLDSAPEEAFDRLTRLAAFVLKVPVTYVSLVEEDRQFFKSQCGLKEPLATTRETPLTHSFCRHAVESGEPLVVADARAHPTLRHNPAVVEHGFVAYAGIPLVTSAGHALGAFCAVQQRPHTWSEHEVGILRALAGSAVSQIEMKLLAHEQRDLRLDLQALVDSRAAELRSAEERHRVLLEVNNAVMTCRDRDSLFEAAITAVRRVVSFDRASILASNGRMNVAELGTAATVRDPTSVPRTLAQVDRQHILSVLRETGWKVSGPRGAAGILGLKRTTLEARMKGLGIVRPA